MNSLKMTIGSLFLKLKRFPRTQRRATQQTMYLVHTTLGGQWLLTRFIPEELRQTTVAVVTSQFCLIFSERKMRYVSMKYNNPILI